MIVGCTTVDCCFISVGISQNGSLQFQAQNIFDWAIADVEFDIPCVSLISFHARHTHCWWLVPILLSHMKAAFCRIRIVTSTLVPINYVGTPAKKVLFHCFAFVDFQTWDRGEFLYQSFRSKICYKSVFIHEWVGVMLSCISSINSYEIALRVNLNRSRSSYFYQQHLSCFSRLLQFFTF